MNKFIKAGISLATVAAIAASASAMVFATDYMGDVNDDGAVNSSDALLILRHSVGDETVTLNLKKADIDTNGTVNSADALAALRMSVGLDELIEIKDDGKEDEKTPVDFDKAELVEYYNNALKKAYASEKVTIAKKTDVKVKIDNLSAFKDIANSLIEKYAVPTEATETFMSDPAKAEKFLVPTALEPDGAKEAKVEATENGYKVTITLVSETVDYKTAPKYNTQASLPLTGIAEIAAQNNVTVKSSSFNYAGTVLTAEIDKDGNILSLNHTMPLKLEATVKYGIMKVEGSGSGQYTLDATFTY